MPLYEYRCNRCSDSTECIRPIAKRNEPMRCHCGSSTTRFMTAPVMHVWNQSRTFPNLTQQGDGTMKFNSKEDYNVHLKENNVHESGLDAPKIKKLSHKTIASYK